MLLIGICGASGSGKSTLAREIAQRVEGQALILAQDVYYQDHPDMPFEEREKLNYDEPAIFEHDQVFSDLSALKNGQAISRKGYDYAQHRRQDPGTPMGPADVVLFEGIHAFYDPRVRELCDFKIFMRVDPDICLLRRAQRDIEKRGRTIEGIARQYLATVKPMYDKYVRNYIDYADIIVAGGGKNARIADVLAFYINRGGLKAE